MNKTLIRLRKERGLSQERVAQEIGISQSMLSSLEKGTRLGSDATKIKLANFYGKSVEYIFFANAIAYRDNK